MKDVYFGLGTKYDSGVQSSIALNERGLVVEVHKSEALSNSLWYRVGRLQPDLRVVWLSGAQAEYYDSGVHPSVTIDNEGLVVEVHSSQVYSTLWHRLGRIGEDYKIEWLSGSQSVKYDVGLNPSVALWQDRILIEAHALDSGDLLYRLGHIDVDGKKIDWITGTKSVKFGEGSSPAVAVGSNGSVIAIHSVKETLNYRTGTRRAVEQDVEWGENPASYDKGYDAAVAMTPDGFVIEIHRAPGTKQTVTSRVGQWLGNSVGWLRKSTYFDDGTDPTVACNSLFAIQVHSSAKVPKLYSSACRIADRSKWMEEQFVGFGNRALFTLVLPASHDAAMYAGGLGTVGKTQELTIGQQLAYGIRYFDLRPYWDDTEFYFYHGFRWVRGDSLKNVLSEVAKFMRDGSKEVVMLKFSHYGRFNDRVYRDLVDQISQTLGEWFYETNQRLSEVRVMDFPTNRGVVLVLCDEDYPVKQPRRGIYVYRDWDSNDPADGDLRVYDKYSDKTSYQLMATDQSNKYRVFDTRCFYRRDVRCELFLLSWTLTPPSDVWDYSQEANRNLGPGLSAIPIPNPIGRMPNLLYVDYVEFSRVTDLSIYLNDFESYGGPISAFETNDKESVVLGVSTTGSLIEKKWSRGIARVNYGPTEVGGGLGMGLGALSVVKTSTGRSVFAISAQKRLLYAYWTGTAWSKWKDRADAGDVVAISATSAINRFVVFGLSDGLELICWTFPFDGLASVQSLSSTDTGGGLWGTLSAITSPDGSVAIFTISQNRDLLSGTWNRGAWVWQNIGNTVLCGGLSGGVAALREGNAIHVFATSEQNRLLYLRKEDDHWGRWEDLGGPNELGNMRRRLCVTKGWNPIDIFALSQNGRLLHKGWGGKDWLDWKVVG